MVFETDTGEQALEKALNKLPARPEGEFFLWKTKSEKVVPMERTLKEFSVEANDMIEVRPRQQIFPITLSDGTVKKIRIDCTLTGEQLLLLAAEKAGIKVSDEFGVQVEGSKTWIEATKPFYEQLPPDMRPSDITKPIKKSIVLKKRFFFADKNVGDEDEGQIVQLYNECRLKIMNDELPVDIKKATQLAGIDLAVKKGPFKDFEASLKRENKVFSYQDKNLIKGLTLEIKQCFSKSKLKKVNNKIIMDVIKEWEKLILKDKTKAMYRYSQDVMNNKMYGVISFEVTEKHPKKAKLIKKIFGVHKDYVILVGKNGKNEQIWPLTKIRRYAAGKNNFILDFGNNEKTYKTLFTTEGEEIVKAISGYIDLILKRRNEVQLEKATEEINYSVSDKVEEIEEEEEVKLSTAKTVEAVADVSTEQVDANVVAGQVQTCLDNYAKMSYEEVAVEGVQEFNAAELSDCAVAMSATITDLYGTDQAVTEAAVAKLGAQTDALYAQYAAAKKADWGAGVLNVDEDEEQLLVACRTATECAVKFIKDEAVLEEYKTAEFLPPQLFQAQAAFASISAMSEIAYVNDQGTQLLLHEMARLVGEGLYDLASFSELATVSAEQYSVWSKANEKMKVIGENEIAAMRLLAPTASDENCQKVIKEMGVSLNEAIAQYLETAKECGIDEDDEVMGVILDQCNAIKSSWEQLTNGTQLQGMEYNPEVMSMVQSLGMIFNEVATLSDPLVTDTQVEQGIDNLEGLLEDVRDTCKKVAQNELDLGNEEKIAEILTDLKEVVNKFFVFRDKLEEGKRGEMIEDDGIFLREALQKLMTTCEMKNVGENMQGIVLNTLAKTAVAKRLALGQVVKRIAAKKGFKTKSLQKELLRASQSTAKAIADLMKTLSLPVDEQGRELPGLVRDFAPKAYELVVDLRNALVDIEDPSLRANASFACLDCDKATFDMVRLNNLFNSTKQAKKENAIAKKEEFEELDIEFDLLVADFDKEDFKVSTVNVEAARKKAKEEIDETIKEIIEEIPKMKGVLIEDLPKRFDKLIQLNKKHTKALKALASTAKKRDNRKALLEAGRRLAQAMKNCANYTIDEEFDKLLAERQEIGDIRLDIENLSKELYAEDVEEKQTKAAEQVEDAATRELIGASNVINDALDKINKAMEIQRKKREEQIKENERIEKLNAENAAKYDAALAAAQAAAANPVIIKNVKKKVGMSEEDIAYEILENAKTLIAETGELISVSTVAQKELTGETKKDQTKIYNKDANWEEGLISAAKTVTGCIQLLVKSANDHVVHGKKSEDMLVACAKSVAANAVQLQTASQVKMESSNPLYNKLSQCIGRLNKAQVELVKTATKDSVQKEENVKLGSTAAKVRIQLMEATVEINNIEKELQIAYRELLDMRKARYGKAAGGNNVQKPVEQKKPKWGGAATGNKTNTQPAKKWGSATPSTTTTTTTNTQPAKKWGAATPSSTTKPNAKRLSIGNKGNTTQQNNEVPPPVPSKPASVVNKTTTPTTTEEVPPPVPSKPASVVNKTTTPTTEEEVPPPVPSKPKGFAANRAMFEQKSQEEVPPPVPKPRGFAANRAMFEQKSQEEVPPPVPSKPRGFAANRAMFERGGK